mmetsp:Transcript_105574/g.305438  ORF Transcript_105574/g.305438 Transcript_105574/m.305438 type:complete len:85 (+) Transcript_105574:126-380(+)
MGLDDSAGAPKMQVVEAPEGKRLRFSVVLPECSEKLGLVVLKHQMYLLVQGVNADRDEAAFGEPRIRKEYLMVELNGAGKAPSR